MSSLRTLTKRLLSSSAGPGPTAGLAIGIAVAIILLLLILAFFTIHLLRLRRAKHDQLSALDAEKLSNSSPRFGSFAKHNATDTQEKSEIAPTVKRNKSVKDRLMGPLYRENNIELQSPPKARSNGVGAERARYSSTSTNTPNQDMEWINKPWLSNSPRPSFSSKRATRLMMIM